MATKSRRLKRIQTTALVLLVVAGMINYLDRSTLSIANHSISQDMNLSASQMGVLLAAFSLPYAFAQLPMGIMLDRFGARVMLGFGMLLWSVAQLAGGFVRTLGQFQVARMVLGVGEAPQFPAGAKVFSDWFALKERGRPSGIFTSSSTLGPALAPPILTVLMLTFHWRGMFIIMGVLGVIAAVLWLLLYRDRRDVKLEPDEVAYLTEGEPGNETEKAVTFKEWSSLFASPSTWGMIFGFIGVIYMVWLYLTWLPGYLERERGVSIADAGWMIAIPYLFGAMGQISSGFVADFLLSKGLTPINSRKWPICVGLLFAAVFTVPAAYTPSLTLALVYISLAMFFVNLSSGGAWTLVAVATPRRLVASLGSVQNFGGYFGGAFAPLITGFIVDETGSFVNALLISAGVAFAGALSYFFIVRRPIADPASSQGAAA